jgi:hypothetical protein
LIGDNIPCGCKALNPLCTIKERLKMRVTVRLDRKDHVIHEIDKHLSTGRGKELDLS